MGNNYVKKYFSIAVLLIILILNINAQEEGLQKEIVEIEEEKKPGINDNKNDGRQKTGFAFSFSGFNEFRLGIGIFLGSLGTDGGHHPLGDDFGLLFEYNFKENIKYTRFYYHLTGGVSAMLLGGSMVVAYDNDDISVGFSPEIGFGLSTLFKIFYRYNFYINNSFNSYEIVFHLCLSKRN
jgi:hypothetical protein